MSEARELAELHAKEALANYRKDGELAPVIIVHGPQPAICLIDSDGSGPNMQNTIYLLTAVFGATLSEAPTHVIHIGEGWMKKEAVTEESMSREEALAEADTRYPKGTLEARAQAGDLSVHTAVLVMVFCLDDPEQSCGITIDVDDGDSREVIEGQLDGGLADMTAKGWAMGKQAREVRPADIDMQTVIDSLSPFVAAVMLGVTEEEAKRFSREGN